MLEAVVGVPHTKQGRFIGPRHKNSFELTIEGVPVPVIQQQLGHTSLVTTDRYLRHLAPKDVVEAIQRREWEP